MRNSKFSSFLILALLCAARSASAFHTIPCSDNTIQGAINSILAEEKANGGANGVDFYIALGGGLVFNEPVVINDNGTPGGVTVAIIGGLNIDPSDPSGCAASPGVFNGTTSVMSGGGRFHQSVIQVTGNANIYLDALTLAGANLGGSGGGISFDGTGSLNLYGVDIANNTAGSGAGIHANGSAPGLGINFHDLVLPSGAHLINFIQQNTATNGPGGGMDLSGETFLSANDGELIVGGNIASGDGGGIAFRGRGSIQLGQNAQLVGNSANNGGGIFVNPTDPSDVTFLDGVIIGGNTAENNGGGVYLGNHTNLHADAAVSPAQIFSNHVTGSSGCGGGIFIAGPAQMSFTGAITSNDSAGNGGGICGLAGSGTGADDVDAVRIALSGVSPRLPARVSSNSASGGGGGIYCRGYQAGSVLDGDTINNCHLTATRFAIDSNTAADGTAIFGDSASNALASHDWGVDVVLNGSCTGQPGCNEISGNSRTSGSAQDGSPIVVPIWSTFNASNVKFQRNQGKHLIVTAKTPVSIGLTTTLITDNEIEDTLIDAPEDQDFVSVKDTTFSRNNLVAKVIRSRDPIVRNSIFDEDADAFDFLGVTTAHDLVDVLTGLSDTTAAPAIGSVLHGHPTFVDAANGDYHLAPYSLGIDVGFVNDQVSTDLDGKQRDFDELAVDNIDGPRDLGAYEFTGVLAPRFCSASDEVFCSEFE